jgi:hypothetical protein
MGVEIDEARSHDLAGCVDDPGRGARRNITVHCRDAVPSYRNVIWTAAARPGIYELAAFHQKIEPHSFTS